MLRSIKQLHNTLKRAWRRTRKLKGPNRKQIMDRVVIISSWTDLVTRHTFQLGFVVVTALLLLNMEIYSIWLQRIFCFISIANQANGPYLHFSSKLSTVLDCIFPKLVISWDRWAGYVLFFVLNEKKFKLRVQECDENGGWSSWIQGEQIFFKCHFYF